MTGNDWDVAQEHDAAEQRRSSQLEAERRFTPLLELKRISSEVEGQPCPVCGGTKYGASYMGRWCRTCLTWVTP